MILISFMGALLIICRTQPKRKSHENEKLSLQEPDDEDEEYLVEYSENEGSYQHDDDTSSMHHVTKEEQMFHPKNVVDISSYSPAETVSEPQQVTSADHSRLETAAPTTELDLWLNGIKATLMVS